MAKKTTAKKKTTKKSNGQAFASATGPQSTDRLSEPVIAGSERTGAQLPGGVAVLFSQDPGGFGRPSAGSIQLYRKIKGHPTVAMARVAATAPVKLTPISFEKKDEDVPDEWIDFIRDQISPLWPMLRNESIRAIDYGAQSFEKVFSVVTTEGSPKIGVRKFKPLLPELTEVRTIRETGAFAGLKQAKVELEATNSFHFSNDQEGGNFYGRSRYENVRVTWHRWEKTAERMGRYGEKVAGVIPLVMYPEGESPGEGGKVENNFDLAMKLLDQLGRDMKGIAFPNVFSKHAEDMIRAGVDPTSIRPWLIQFVETKGNHGKDFVDQLQYWDKLLIRGMLVPERAISEGQHGTKAEAGAHIDIAVSVAEDVAHDIVRCLNWYAIDQLLVLNFGEAARGAVFAVAGELSDTDKAFVRELIGKVLTSPNGIQLFFDVLDANALLERADLPRNPDFDDEIIIGGGEEDEGDEGKPKTGEGEDDEPVVDPAPVAPAPPQGDTGAGAANVVEGVKLNGGQVAQAQNIVADLIADKIPEEVAIELIVSLGIPLATAKRMIEAAKRHKEKVAKNKPTPPSGGAPPFGAPGNPPPTPPAPTPPGEEGDGDEG